MEFVGIKSELKALSDGVASVERAFAFMTIRDFFLPKVLTKRYNNARDAIFRSLRWNDYNELKRLLEYCREYHLDVSSMREKTMEYCNVLIAAVRFKVSIEFVKELVHWVEPQAQDAEGNTVLHVSLMVGDCVLYITKFIMSNYYPVLCTIANRKNQSPEDIVRRSIDIKENYSTIIYSIEKINKFKSEECKDQVLSVSTIGKKKNTFQRSPINYYVPTVGVLPSHETYYYDEYGHIEIAGDFFVTADELSPDRIVHHAIVEENPDLTPINVNNVIIHVRLPKQEPFEPDRDRRRELRREKIVKRRDPILYSAKKEQYLAKK